MEYLKETFCSINANSIIPGSAGYTPVGSNSVEALTNNYVY